MASLAESADDRSSERGRMAQLNLSLIRQAGWQQERNDKAILPDSMACFLIKYYSVLGKFNMYPTVGSQNYSLSISIQLPGMYDAQAETGPATHQSTPGSAMQNCAVLYVWTKSICSASPYASNA